MRQRNSSQDETCQPTGIPVHQFRPLCLRSATPPAFVLLAITIIVLPWKRCRTGFVFKFPFQFIIFVYRWRLIPFRFSFQRYFSVSDSNFVTCSSKFSDTNRVTSSEFVALEEEWYNYKKWFRIFKEVAPRARKIENFNSKISKSRFRCYSTDFRSCRFTNLFRKKRRREICHFEKSSLLF